MCEYRTCNKSKRVNWFDNNSSVALGWWARARFHDVHFIASGASDYDKLDLTGNKAEHIFDIPAGPQWFLHLGTSFMLKWQIK